MSNHNTLLLRVLVVALVLSALVTPSLDAAVAPDSPPALTADFAETSIRMIYDRFAQQTRDSGNEVTVSLSGFQTIRPEEFDDYYYFVDLVTPPGGWTLRAGLTYFAEPGDYDRFDDALGMHLDPAWFDEFEWLPTQPPAIRDGTLKDLVDLYERERPKEPRAVAYTTYTVEISYAGRTRSYQAAMKWFEAKEEDERSGIIQDQVMPDLLIVVGEDLEVMREHPALTLPLERESSPASSCVPLDMTETLDDPPVLPIGSSVEHQSGRHEAQSFNEFRCTCDSGCVSRCTHRHYLPPLCQDYGALIGSVACHRTHYAVRSAPTTNFAEGAECSGAMACYVESCPLNCQCNGVTITISVVLGGLQISVQGNTLWGFESVPKTRCPNCQEVNPPFPGEPDLPCHDPVPVPHFQPVAGGILPGGESLFSNFPLDRVEYVEGRPYLMEEWAILVVERDAAGALVSVEVPTASSSAYAAHQRDSLVNNLGANPGISSPPSGRDVAERSVLFILHHPDHPHNVRWIPRPKARLGRRPVVFMGAPERAVVRADFAEDRTLRALDVLYSDRSLTEEELAFIEQNLTLVYANDNRHRVVLYGVARLDGETIGPESRQRTIDLESYMPVPSMCCCPDWPDCSSGGP